MAHDAGHAAQLDALAGVVPHHPGELLSALLGGGAVQVQPGRRIDADAQVAALAAEGLEAQIDKGGDGVGRGRGSPFPCPGTVG